MQKITITHQLPKSFLQISKNNVTTINQDPQPPQHETSIIKTSKSQDQNLEEERGRLKNEVASLKKRDVQHHCNMLYRYEDKFYQLHHQNRHHKR